MSSEQTFKANEEQKEFLDLLTTTYYVLINNVTGIHPRDISMDDLGKKVFDDKVELYGYVIAKLHLYYEMPISYEEFTEFDEFPTLGDAYNHIAEFVMLRDGLIKEEEV